MSYCRSYSQIMTSPYAWLSCFSHLYFSPNKDGWLGKTLGLVFISDECKSKKITAKPMGLLYYKMDGRAGRSFLPATHKVAF